MHLASKKNTHPLKVYRGHTYLGAWRITFVNNHFIFFESITTVVCFVSIWVPFIHSLLLISFRIWNACKNWHCSAAKESYKFCLQWQIQCNNNTCNNIDACGLQYVLNTICSLIYFWLANDYLYTRKYIHSLCLCICNLFVWSLFEVDVQCINGTYIIQ